METKNSLMGKAIKVIGLMVTMIVLISERACLTICLATQSGDITPIGFRLLLNGPNINFRMTQGASKRLSVIKSPNVRLLSSYNGLNAGLTSASEVFTQTSFFGFVCVRLNG